jgi:NitT/TauT family transport system permease protein
MQPIAQFMAAFPANLMFPVAVVGILRFHLNPEIWLSPLIILGTQWYILFNVIAGTMAFPSDLREAARSFHVDGWLWWKKIILPGIMPYYVTGALTATGGAWNATIVSEYVSWGDEHLQATGIGAYIARMTDRADYAHIVLGIAVMSLYVIFFNRTVWHPLYKWSERRFKLA